VLISGVLAAGCGGASGGSASQSNKAQVEDTTRTFIDALRDGDNATACSVTTDPAGCLDDMALAQGLLGKNGSWSTLFPDGWESRMENARIVFHGNTATMAAFSPSGQKSNSNPTKFKKVSGKWLLDMSDDSSSSSAQQSATPKVPAGTVLKTDAQAETYLKTNLKTWDGLNLAKRISWMRPALTGTTRRPRRELGSTCPATQTRRTRPERTSSPPSDAT